MLRNHPTVFRDVTLGDNGPGPGVLYPATAGYDLATGIGSVGAHALALQLAAYNPAAPSPSPTSLTAAPGGPRIAPYGSTIVFHGRLTDSSGAVAGARVYLQGVDLLGFRTWTDVTDEQGDWSIALGPQIVRKTRWRVSYLGSEQESPALHLGSTVYVIPRIGVAADLPVVAGMLTATSGRPFLLRGRTTPNLRGRTLVAYIRRAGAARWTPLGPETVAATARVSRSVSVSAPGLYQLRWRFAGGPTGQWMSSSSPPITVRVARG
jgi:hypothetical protein